MVERLTVPVEIDVPEEIEERARKEAEAGDGDVENQLLDRVKFDVRFEFGD